MAKTKKISRVIAFALTLVMMLTIVPFQGLAADVDPTAVVLHNGKAAISSDMNADQVKKALFNALVSNPEGLNYQDYEWEFFQTGYDKLYTRNDWGSVNGFETWANPPGILWQEKYTHAALKDSGDTEYSVRLAGATQEVRLTKVSSCTVNFDYEATQGKVFANGANVIGEVGGYSPIAGINLTVEPVEGYEVASVKVNGEALTADNDVYAFVPAVDTTVNVTFREAVKFNNITLNPAEGVSYKVNGFDAKDAFSVAENTDAVLEFITDANTSINKVVVDGIDVTADVVFNNYNGTYTFNVAKDAEVTVETVKSEVVLSGETVIPVVADKNGNWDLAAIRETIIDVLVADSSTIGDFDRSKMDVTYDANTVVGDGVSAYKPIDFKYAGIAWEQTFWWHAHNRDNIEIRLAYAGDDQYRPTAYVNQVITVDDLNGSNIAVRSGVQNFVLNQIPDGNGGYTYDYEALRQAIYNAVIDEAHSYPEGAVTYDNIKLTYKILDAMGSSVGIGAGKFYEFEQGWLGSDAAGTYKYLYKGGQFTVKASLPSTADYYGTEVEFDVNVEIKDLPTAKIAVKEGYNKNFTLVQNLDRTFDYAAFETALYDAVIDEAASEFATRDTVKFVYDIKADGNYTVKAVVAETEAYHGAEISFGVTVTVEDKFTTEIVIDETAKNFTLAVKELVNGSPVYDYDALKEAIFNAAVAEVKNLPEGTALTWDDFSYEYIIYDAMGSSTGIGAGQFYSLEQGWLGADAAGTYKYLYKGGNFTFKVKLADAEGYYGSEATFTADVAIADLGKTNIDAKDGATVVLNINKDRTYDYDGLKKAILDEVLTVTGADVTWEDLKFEFKIYDDGAAIKTWVPFETRKHASDTDEILYHYLYQGGKFDFRVTLPNGTNYYGSDVYFTANVKIVDNYTAKIALKDGYKKDYTLYYKDVNSFDYDRLMKEIYDNVIDAANSYGNVSYENVVMTYDVTDGMLIHYPDSPFNTVGSDVADPEETLFNYLHEGGTFTVKFAIPTAGGLYGTSVSVSLNIAPFERAKTSVVLNGNAEMDYVANPDAIKQYIFDNVISKSLSILPEGVTVDDFTFEYYAQNYTAGGLPGVEKMWVPFEGMSHPTLAGSYFKPIGAGDHYFRVYYNGNTEYAPSDWTSGNEMISLPKPEFTIDRLSQSYIYRKDELPENFIQCSANTEGADINYRLLFTTTTNSGTALVYLQSRDGYDKGDFIWDLQNEVIINVFHGAKTGDSILREGLTIDEYKQLIESPELFAYFQKWYDMDAADMAVFKTAAYSRLGGMSRVEIRLGTPVHAAHYDLFVGAYNENFETAVRHTGFDVKYNSRGNKLIWREDATGLNTINSRNFDFGADVTVDGTSQSDGNVKYLYTGFFYCSSNAPRGKAGWFIQTAWTKAGTTYCFPQTRSFKISVL